MTTIKEYDQDAPATSTTTYTVQNGDTVHGSMATGEDKDWFAITLTQGSTYEIYLNDLQGGQLCLKNGEGETIHQGISVGNMTRLVYNPASNETLYIEVSSGINEAGSYRMRVEREVPIGTLAELADYLEDGYWDAMKWDTSADKVITVNMEALLPEARELTKTAFQAWAAIMGLEFVYTTEEDANITMTSKGDEAPGAYVWRSHEDPTLIQGAGINMPRSIFEDWGYTVGEFPFEALLHEIGHALGLGHGGAYNHIALWGVHNVFLIESKQATVMSYFDQDQNSLIPADTAYNVTPMPADVIAVQTMYGEPAGINEGNTRYGYRSNTGDYMDDYWTRLTTDTDVLTNLIKHLNFTEESGRRGIIYMEFHDLDGDGKEDLLMGGHTKIAFLRNTGSNGNIKFELDTVNDHGVNDIAIEYAFVQPILADMDKDGKVDLIVASTNGNSGPERIQYFKQTESGFVEDTENNLFRNVQLNWAETLAIGDLDGDGWPEAITGDNDDGLIFFWNREENEERVLVRATGNNNPTAGIVIKQGLPTPVLADMDNDGDLDLIIGSAHGRVFYYENTGTDGEVIFVESEKYKIGQIRGDQLTAPAVGDLDGDGKPEIILGTAEPVIRWHKNTGTLDDPEFEPVSLRETTTVTIMDTGGVDTLDFRTDKTDQIINMDAEAASDIYGVRGSLVIGPSTIIERVVAGRGDDIVNGNSANNLVHGGGGHDRLYGKGGDDILYGNNGNDRLNGGAGADTLEGGTGSDTLTGGPGNDTASYSKSQAGVTVRLHSDQSSGGDAAGDTFAGRVDITWTDAAGVEHTENLPDIENLTGSAFDDTLAGDRRDNRLEGGAGNDTLYGGPGGGDDTLSADDGNDSLFGGEGNDTLQGGQGNDRLSGGAGQDVFVFVPGTYEDTITDFTLGEDKIDLTAFGLDTLENLVAVTTDNVVVLDSDLLDGVSVVLEGLTSSEISDDHFIV